jgi:hypothetical protein
MKMTKYLVSFSNGETTEVTGFNFREAILRAAVHGLDQAWGSQVVRAENLDNGVVMDNIEIIISI